MFTENEVKVFLKAKVERKATGFLFVLLATWCFGCAWLGYEVLDIPADSMAVIGAFISIQAISYFTSVFGSGKVISLVEKAVNSDPEAVKILAKINNT